MLISSVVTCQNWSPRSCWVRWSIPAVELEVQLKRSWRLHTRAIVAVREPQSPLCPVGCMRCSLIMRTHEVRSVKSEGGRLCVPKRKCTCIQLMQAFTVCSLLNQPNRSSNLGCATYQLQMQLTFDLKPRLDLPESAFSNLGKKKNGQIAHPIRLI